MDKGCLKYTNRCIQIGKTQTYHLYYKHPDQTPFYKYEYKIQTLALGALQNHSNLSNLLIWKDEAMFLT